MTSRCPGTWCRAQADRPPLRHPPRGAGGRVRGDGSMTRGPRGLPGRHQRRARVRHRRLRTALRGRRLAGVGGLRHPGARADFGLSMSAAPPRRLLAAAGLLCHGELPAAAGCRLRPPRRRLRRHAGRPPGAPLRRHMPRRQPPARHLATSVHPRRRPSAGNAEPSAAAAQKARASQKWHRAADTAWPARTGQETPARTAPTRSSRTSRGPCTRPAGTSPCRSSPPRWRTANPSGRRHSPIAGIVNSAAPRSTGGHHRS
jgi:hypothetical protein